MQWLGTYLPEEAEGEVGLAGCEVLRANVDNVAADGSSRVESKVLILCGLVHIQLLLVYCSLVNGTSNRRIDQLTVRVVRGCGQEGEGVVRREWVWSVIAYHKTMPSLIAVKRASPSSDMGRTPFKSSSASS